MPPTVARPESLDALFRTAVAAIDQGDVLALQRVLGDNPRLVHERLEDPGSWLRDAVGGALDSFFAKPYLLWFVAEDPVRNGTLPPNIALVAGAIIDAARRQNARSLPEQLDHALRLTSWSWIARQCNVQIELIDVLADAGAALDGNPENALVNGNVAAAGHLVKRGARLTLASALCLGRGDEARGLAATASARDKQFALVLAALRGNADAIRTAIGFGADVNGPSPDLYAHATPLHHAVHSGSIDAVRVLVAAGASLDIRDTSYDGTPLEWAEYGNHAAIAGYLRGELRAAGRGASRS